MMEYYVIEFGEPCHTQIAYSEFKGNQIHNGTPENLKYSGMYAKVLVVPASESSELDKLVAGFKADVRQRGFVDEDFLKQIRRGRSVKLKKNGQNNRK